MTAPFRNDARPLAGFLQANPASGLLAGLCAAVLLAAGGAPLWAQSFDPPDTEYSNGYQEDDPDFLRTLPLEPTHRAYIPTSVDLSYRLPEPGNQGRAQSCTAWAIAYAARSYYTSAYESRDTRDLKNVASPAFVFNVAWPRSKTHACNSGISFANAVDVLKQGAPSLAAYPYRASDCAAPAPETIASARDFRVAGLRRIDQTRIDDVKGALARSHPVVISLRDDAAWQHFRGAGVFDRTSLDVVKGWHAMTLVGYDERKQAFRLINSWGKRWGDNGYAWISYEAFKARVRQAVILDVERPKTPVAVRPQPNVAVSPPRPLAEPPRPQPRPTEQKRPAPAPLTELKPAPAPAVPVQPAPLLPPPAPEVRPAPAPAVETRPAPVAPPVVAQPAPPPAPPAPPPQPSGISDLAQMPCAKVAVRRAGNQNILDGYVGSDAALLLVRQVAAETPGTAVGDVTVAPWPQCEAIQTLEKPLAVLDRPTIDIGPRDRLGAGETLRIAIRSPEQISYLYVSYVQADGSVVHLVQPDGLVPQPTLPRQTLTFGDGANGSATFTISEPFGREMIIAIASRSPLFDHPLPARQTEREYLTELRRALVYKPSPDLPDRELGASIKTLQTEAR
jgi:hypothetical protein